MAFLTDDELKQVVEQVFKARETTLEAAASSHSVQDLVQTVQRMRLEPQPDDAEGNEVWNAGQIISHIIASQIRMTENLDKLVDFKVKPDTGDLKTEDELDMSGTRSAIKFATKALTSTLKGIPEDADLSKTVDAGIFGEMGVRGWLLLTAVHEMDHVQQLRSLA